jgi:hypothetical protein
VVQGDATDFAFLGETGSGGRRLFEYSFRVPVERSHYYAGLAQGTVATSWDGTLLIDPETSELVRMTTRTSELPSGAFGCEHTTAAEYGRVKIGAREFLLARETRQRFIDRSGAEVENVVTFSGCREYEVQTPAAPAKAAPRRRLDLPVGLPVTIALASGIDSATAAGGDRFTGRLAEPVKDSRDMILLPEGTVVAGRLIQVAVHMRPPLEVAIVLRVDSVQVDGAEFPIHLTGKTPVKGGWLGEVLSNLSIGAGGGRIGGPPGRAGGDRSPEPREEINDLRFPGTRRVLEAGFKTEWVTVKP